MGQDFLLNCRGSYSYKNIKCLSISILVLTVSNIKRKAIKRYACCVEIKLHLELAQDFQSLKSMQLRKKLLASIMVHTLVCYNQQVTREPYHRVTREFFIQYNSNFRKTISVMLQKQKKHWLIKHLKTMLGERKRFAEDLMDTILKPGNYLKNVRASILV